MNILTQRFRGRHGLTPAAWQTLLGTLRRYTPISTKSVTISPGPRAFLPRIPARQGAGGDSIILGDTEWLPEPLTTLSARRVGPVAPPAGKFAIVPIPHPDGTDAEHIGWFCSEQPSARFRDTIRIPLVDQAGSCRLPRELIESIVPGSLRVVSAMPIGAPVAAFARIDGDKITAFAAPPREDREVVAVVARIDGERRHMPTRWPRFTSKQAATNTDFYRAAFPAA